MAAKRKRAAQQAAEDSDPEDLEVGEPPSTDPYATLEVDEKASAGQIKSAYRRLALKYHPDKVTETDKASAHTKFQEIAAAYAILSDEVRRKRYDTTGRTDDSLGEDGDFDWATFYREQYTSLVSEERIEEFSKEYKGSEEERNDILNTYTKVKGNMDKLYQEVMLSDPVEDDERFRAIIVEAIDAGEIEGFKSKTNEKANGSSKRAAKKASREAKEAEELAEELGLKKKGQKMDDLASLIKGRQQNRALFFDNLEEKYGGGKKSKHDEPSEEAFAKNAKRKKTKS